MKYKVTLATAVFLLAGNSWANQQPYYTFEELNVSADGAKYGPFPSAMTEDGAYRL
ncbi:hypothetical protein [Psychromonas sp. MME2]|uniref:hypothetical protein n=1 Tax=Psychromonas sp. MME2 TaxID=3231033 RepID=UPI00339CBA28